MVFVVKPGNTVEIRPVTLGPARGGKTVIEKGLAAGETVVTDGQMALFPGAPVRIVEPAKAEPAREDRGRNEHLAAFHRSADHDGAGRVSASCCSAWWLFAPCRWPRCPAWITPR